MSALPTDIANNPILSRWFSVSSDGRIHITAGRVELGQGISTALLQIAADELVIPPERLMLTAGDTSCCPDQGLTAGSMSVEISGMALRQICAEIRTRFTRAASARLQVDLETIEVVQGCFRTQNASLSYAELAQAVDLDSPVTERAPLRSSSQQTVCGTSLARPDFERKLFGSGFIHDIEWPGILHGRMVRPASMSSQLIAIDETKRAAVLAMPGVQCVQILGRWIAVAAEREEQANAAAEALSKAIQWGDGALGLPDTNNADWLCDLPGEDSVVESHESMPSDPPAVHRLRQDYSKPFLSHASIGPSCALASWQGDALTVITHAQGSFALRRALAQFFELPLESLTVRHADGAGCYGHNGADDVAFDAAILARAAGRPVRMQWRRDEDFAWAPMGPAMRVRMAAGLDATARIVEWHHETWSPTHVQRPGVMPGAVSLAGQLIDARVTAAPLRDYPLPIGGGHRNAIPLYAIPARRIDYHLKSLPSMRPSALRALGAFANVFAIESFMDELAEMARQDPLDFRIAHLNDLRAVGVLEKVAEMSDWRAPLTGANRGRGLAIARYKGSSAWCAIVVEVEVTQRIVLDRIWVAVDAGEVINPDGVINQVEGGVIQAASWTLKEAVHWDQTHIMTRSFAEYPILGFNEVPRLLQVSLMPAADLPPLGVGECAAGPTAAAIANALADATGLRVRDLPLTEQRLKDTALL